MAFELHTEDGEILSCEVCDSEVETDVFTATNQNEQDHRLCRFCANTTGWKPYNANPGLTIDMARCFNVLLVALRDMEVEE